jgi:LysM repeat protein
VAKTQLKILLFLVTLGITLGCIAAAYYIYEHILLNERRIQIEMAQMKRTEMPKIDPGARRFDVAASLIQQGRGPEAREALYKILQQFPDSATCREAKRIIGEMNLDELYASTKANGAAIDHIVQPGQALSSIANKYNSSPDMIIRLNGLMHLTLQPGDHLNVVPLDFSIVVSLSAKTLTLRRQAGAKQYFFKEYPIQTLRLPSSLKAPAELQIDGKFAQHATKVVDTRDLHYPEADKWLPATRASSKGAKGPGTLIRSLPKLTSAPINKDKKATSAPPELADPATETGLFLSRNDLEEVFALVRNGSKLYLVR